MLVSKQPARSCVLLLSLNGTELTKCEPGTPCRCFLTQARRFSTGFGNLPRPCSSMDSEDAEQRPSAITPRLVGAGSGDWSVRG